MWGHMGVMGGGGMGWGMLIFWGLLIVGIVLLVRCSRGYGCEKNKQEKSAIELLKACYERGEIERKEFEQKKRDLEG